VQNGPDNFNIDLDGGISIANANRSQDVGLGALTTDTGQENSYRWRQSWLDETGSESALSAPSTAVNWFDTASNINGKVVPVGVAPGPAGTIARRVYRTAFSDETYRLVAEIPNNIERLYYDSVPDSQLGAAAPTTLTVMPAPSARYAAMVANCAFFDGGPHNPMALFYSRPGAPAEFDVSDFVYMDGVGGDITGLAGYYNALLIYRENRVDVLTGSYPNFRVSTLLTDAGARAPQSGQPVPGYGTMFLADDGVYSFTGGMEGGSVSAAKRLSDPIQGFIRRITPAAAASAEGVVCRKWKEYQLWVSIDGSTDKNIGLIFHYDTGQWTVRTGWPVGCVTSAPDGDVIFGHSTGASGSADLEGGLFVMSEARQMGYEKKGDVFVDSPPPSSVYLSKLESLQDPANKKHLRYVHLLAMVTGSNTQAVTAEADRGALVNTAAALTTQPSDRNLQPTFSFGISNEQGVWDTAIWQNPLPVDIRYSVVLDGAGYMQFRLSTVNDMVLTGYTLGIVQSRTEVIEGRGPTTRRSM
tara:strand:- start:99 stop:1682 length:1584 start_codon:yes stop_codon:yes gene_type:complete